jgi:hypothetical protein
MPDQVTSLQEAVTKALLGSALYSTLLSPICVQPASALVPQPRFSKKIEYMLAIPPLESPLFDQSVAISILGLKSDTLDHLRDLEGRLRQQAEQWDRETAHLSSPLQRMMHPSYQAIMGMSAESAEDKRNVIRFLLRDMNQNRRDWLLALSYLTDENPINPKDSGKTDKMIMSWMKWGEEKGLL